MMEINLANPKADQKISPIIGADKCFVKIMNDVCK